ncbi:hypothetical protein SAMN05518672_101820 [Chitinophaga sp. CF118]|uniref:DUF6929 family protein n=1 Tax=Chitinophaga sp. CF118 TaxID=1884367 RepID=UPI0008F05588|nr:hypothetical protein [Chitinophaga sp. CF118]SFD16260.1 hypothetical protein SAMN05518672_101820 [Chitinophaga sp. CF118]
MIAKIVLLKSLLLNKFPSGSAINYYNGKLYLIGDDAKNMLVLNTDYQEIDSLKLFDYSGKRIPKAEKADFETAVLVNVNDKIHLLILGSASGKEREKGILIPLPASDVSLPEPQAFSNAEFIKRVKMKGIPEINIEGATLIGDHLILSNRGNSANRENHLVITEKDFWIRQNEAALSVLQVAMPFGIKEVPGISELCYVESKDILLFTLSSEATNNAYDDGVIGDSYIGWVNGINQKLQRSDIVLDGLINLSDVDADFKSEKIEGVCIESASGNELILHLIADNDQGESRLFNIKLVMGN